jgi:hypothetical protein
LIEGLGIECGLQAIEISLCLAQILLRIVERLLDVRIAQFEDHGVRGHLHAGTQHDALDAALRGGRHPAARLVDGHQRAEAADLPHHRPALHGVDPDGGAFNGRRRGFQLREHDRDDSNDDDGDGAKQDLLALLGLRHGCGTLNVHCSSCLS